MVDLPFQDPPWTSEHAPDLSGPAGRAWRVHTDADSGDPRIAVYVGSWLLHAPGSHPLWPWYLLAGIALRHAPGCQPAYKQFEDAEYELLVAALNPEVPIPDPRVGLAGAWHTLQPVDQVIQFPALPQGDSHMRQILELTTLSVVDGRLIPDQDHRETWHRVMATTADHFVRGIHD